jgi:hypothetical protein
MSVRVFPNPASQIIRIETESIGKDRIYYEMYNLQGKKVITGQLSKGEETREVDVNDLPSGTYILRILHKTDYKSYKVIKR